MMRLAASLDDDWFGIAEAPKGEIVNLAVGTSCIILGHDPARGESGEALCQFERGTHQMATFIPWSKLHVHGTVETGRAVS